MIIAPLLQPLGDSLQPGHKTHVSVDAGRLGHHADPHDHGLALLSLDCTVPSAGRMREYA